MCLCCSAARVLLPHCWSAGVVGGWVGVGGVGGRRTRQGCDHGRVEKRASAHVCRRRPVSVGSLADDGEVHRCDGDDNDGYGDDKRRRRRRLQSLRQAARSAWVVYLGR